MFPQGPHVPAEQQAADGQQREGHCHLLLRQEAQFQGARGEVKQTNTLGGWEVGTISFKNVN